MNKKILLLVSTFPIILLSSIYLISNQKMDSDLITDTQIYIVKEFEGNVAVFRYGNDTPVQILDCIIKDLPPDAVKALATGIEVNSINELQKIIEAYD